MWNQGSKLAGDSSSLVVAHFDCINSGVSEELLFASSIDAASDGDDSRARKLLQDIATTIKDTSGVECVLVPDRINTKLEQRKESPLRIQIDHNVESTAGNESSDDGDDEKKSCVDQLAPSCLTFTTVKDILSRGTISNDIPQWVCDRVVEIFTEVVTAGAKVNHVQDEDDGNMNASLSRESFVYILGTLLALYALGVNSISCSPIPLPDGVADSAIIQLLMGMPTTIPTTSHQGAVILTPIGVAMLRVLSGVPNGKANRRPQSTVLLRSGIGTTNPGSSVASSASHDPAPAVRILIGEDVSNVSGDVAASTVPNYVKRSSSYKSKMWMSDTVTQFSCNLDDITGESLAYVIDLLMKNGAVDAWVTPIVMKKGRPAHTLHCLCPSSSSIQADDGSDKLGHPATSKKLLELLFRHTTTLGVRIYSDLERAKVRRTISTVQTPFGVSTTEGGGLVRVKVGQFLNSNELLSIKAEFDDCREISDETGVPLSSVADHAIRNFLLNRPKETMIVTEDDSNVEGVSEYGDGDESGSGTDRAELHYEEESC